MEDTQLEDKQSNDNQQQNNLPSVPDQQVGTSSPDDSPKKRLNIPRNVIFIFSIISLCLVILFGGIWSIDRINELSKKVTDIETQLNKAQEQYQYINNQLEEELLKNNDLSDRLSKMTNKVQELQNENSNLILESTKLQDENKSLQDEIVSLKNQLEQAKTAQIQSTTSTSTTSYETSTNIPSEPVGSMVWITATGKKYHNKPDCGRSNPNTSYQVTLSEAQSMGYGACKKCY